MKSMLKSLMSVVAAALALTSCLTDATEDVMPNGGSKTLVVNASIDRTRTFMKADDHKILEWAKDDQIHLYIGAEATEANSINPVTGGKITDVTYEDGKTVVYAYYSLPDEGGKTSKNAKEALINIVQEQQQSAANVFAGKNLPMVAKGTITGGQVKLAFQPVGCVFVFNVYGRGKNAGEKITSIKFETPKGTGCCGYDYCDLTAETFGYTVKGENNNNVTVTLGTPAAIRTSKPDVTDNTKIGGNQVYLVVAQANYPAGSKFIVTTDAKENNTYTFVTGNGIDCSQNTARVVNLNLEKSEEFKPAIKVPYVPLQSCKPGNRVIEGIEFLNIATSGLSVANVVSVYSDAGLTEPGVTWLTIRGTDADLFTNGTLHYYLEANTTASDRTAYICIKCADAQAVIAVTQLPEKYFEKVTENLDDWTGKYLIVYESEQHVFNGSISDKDKIWKSNNCFKFEFTGQSILLTGETKAALVNISKKEDSTNDYKYLLQTASGLYLYADKDDTTTGSAASTNLADASQYPNYISIEGSDSETFAMIKSSAGPVMRYNENYSKKPTIKFYKSDTYTGQKAIQLYKLQE